MTAVVAALIACIVILRGWPDLPLARWLAAVLVLPVAGRLNRLTPGHWLLFAIVSAAVGAVLWMGGDMIVVSAMGSPEIAGLLAVVDVAAWLDAALAAIAAAGAMRGTSLRRWIARVPRPRSARARRTRTVARKAANDDDPAGAGLRAA